MWKKIKIGYSQVPQIMFMIVGLVFMVAFQFTDNNAYAIVTLVCLQISAVLMAVYDEREDEKKANAEAFAMLESRVKSNG